MLEALFVLFLCAADGPQCEVLVVGPSKEFCETQKTNIIQQRGEPPKELVLRCQAYEMAEDWE
jgi:hypothetical protein